MHDQMGPLTGSPPPEITLPEAPLVRVLAQVRFPLITSIESDEFISGFQEALRKTYPVLRPERSSNVTLTQLGAQSTQARVVWRFLDPRSGWRITLAPEFLALETTNYTSRDDFVGRLRQAVDALYDHIEPAVVDRLGVRYIDRVTGGELDDLAILVRPEVGGILSTPLSEFVQQAVTEHIFAIPDESGLLRARWGLLPGGATVDPATIEPMDRPSWILDIDAFRVFEGGSQVFDSEAIERDGYALASRIYSVFRWAVTDEFLRRYGGQP